MSLHDDALPASPIHIPVLCDEVLSMAHATEGQFWVDGTSGGGGHTRLLAERVGSSGSVLALDRDPDAVISLRERMPENVHAFCNSYHHAHEYIERLGHTACDGILLDLGLSSDQLDDRSRGFSFQGDGELDMRFDRTEGQPVWQWMHHIDERTLANTIFEFGEERFSRRIARRIVEERKKGPIKTASQLRELIHRAVPLARRATTGNRKHGRIDPATRTFQALRIAVNEELQILTQALRSLPECLSPGGLFLVISFHSLEDRLVKCAFREDLRLEVVTKKPIIATDQEVQQNPRARSAKLRVARRVAFAT